MDEHPGARRIDAAEANRLASELNHQAYQAIPVDDDSQVGTVPESRDDAPLEADLRPKDEKLFPPDFDAGETIGGSPEAQEILREEESR